MTVSNKTIGLIGGGQLGLMLKPAADRLGLRLHVQDLANCPLANKVEKLVEGSTLEGEKTKVLARDVDLITIEIERVDAEILAELERNGMPVYPQPRVISLIQDKGTQKTFFKENGIPTSDFEYAAETPPPAEMFPLVQKLCRGGYDGKGVQILNQVSDWENRLEGESILEDKVDIDKELAVIVVRSTNGEMKTFAPVEMVFNPELNLLDYLQCPANITEEQSRAATELAIQVSTKLENVGLLAVELFLTKSGEILVNELAPRPHNSGHHTIEACPSSQFDQHLLSVLGLPLAETHLTAPFALMYNLLGEPGHTGPAHAQGLDEIEALEGVAVHLYGKEETRPGRKMGHVTILAENAETAREKLEHVRKCLKIVSKK